MATETATQAITGKDYQLLINGEWVASKSGETLERRYPANTDVVATFPTATAEDVDAAIAAARAAFDSGGWAKAPARQRADVLRKTAQKIRDEHARPRQAPRLRGRQARERGGHGSGDDGRRVRLLRRAGAEREGPGRSNYVDDALGLILKEPVGVVGIITPWNFPMLLATWKLAPALAVGCTTVIKPATYTPCTTYELGRILTEAGAPAGVDQRRHRLRQDRRRPHRRIASSSTRSRSPARRRSASSVMRAAAGNVKKISLELGGKSPNIIFADAPLQSAVIGSLFGIYLNAGQVCQAGSRVLVQKEVHDQFMSMFTQLRRPA